METAIKTIVTLVLVLTVLMVVGIYFTTGTFQIYSAAAKFEDKATSDSGGAGLVLRQLSEDAWADKGESTPQEVLVAGTKIELIKKCIHDQIDCDVTLTVNKNFEIKDVEGDYYVINYDGIESGQIGGYLINSRCSCINAGDCKVEIRKGQNGVTCTALQK